MFAKAKVSSGDLPGEEYDSKLTYAAIGMIQFFAGYWSEAALSFLPCGPFHKAAHNITVSSFYLEQVRENKKILKIGALGFFVTYS